MDDPAKRSVRALLAEYAEDIECDFPKAGGVDEHASIGFVRHLVGMLKAAANSDEEVTLKGAFILAWTFTCFLGGGFDHLRQALVGISDAVKPNPLDPEWN